MYGSDTERLGVCVVPFFCGVISVLVVVEFALVVPAVLVSWCVGVDCIACGDFVGCIACVG